MNRPSYGTAVFRPMSGPVAIDGPRAVVLRSPEPELAGIFGSIAHAIGHAVSSVEHDVSHAASDVARGVGAAVHDVGDAAKWGLHVVEHPAAALHDATSWVTHAAGDIGKFVGHNLVTVVQLVQVGVSFIPGIGAGISAAMGASLALAEGKGISAALIAAVQGALPGGPLVAAAFSAGAEAVGGAIEGKSFASIVGNVVADNVPGGGDLAKTVVHAAANVIGAATTGKSVGQALLTGVTGAVGNVLPIHALTSTLTGAAGQVLSGVAGQIAGAALKPLNVAALQAARERLQGGDAARTAFDMALALTHARQVQQAGIASPASLLPDDPAAVRNFHATRVVVAVGLQAKAGISFEALHQLQLRALQAHILAGAPPVPRPSTSAADALRRRPSYARAALHPASAPLGGLFDDFVQKSVSTAANAVQAAAGAGSALPGPFGTVARAIATPATAAAKAASAPALPPSVTPKPHAMANARATTHDEPSSLVLPLAVGGAALAAAGGAVWWVRRSHVQGGGPRR